MLPWVNRVCQDRHLAEGRGGSPGIQGPLQRKISLVHVEGQFLRGCQSVILERFQAVNVDAFLGRGHDITLILDPSGVAAGLLWKRSTPISASEETIRLNLVNTLPVRSPNLLSGNPKRITL